MINSVFILRKSANTFPQDEPLISVIYTF